MKNKAFNIISISLLSLFASFGVFSSNTIKESNASETKIEYCDIGPATFNKKQDNTPEDRFDGNNYSISVRGGKLLIYPNKDYYKDSARGGKISASELVDTNFDNIRFYTDKNNFKTLSEHLPAISSFYYTVFADAGLHIAIDLNKSSYVLKNIYQITFEEGFVFPYASNDHSTKLVLKQSLIFKYNGYHTSDKEETFFASSWSKSVNEKEVPGKEGYDTIDIAAFARDDSLYRAHVRGDVEYDPEILPYDDGSARLFLFFGDADYNFDIYSQSNVSINAERFDVSDTNEKSFLYTLYEKVLLIGPDKTVRTLREVSNPEEKGLPIYNCWGEHCCIAFNIGSNYGTGTGKSYCGDHISAIKILRGCEFPKASYTNGGDKRETRYVQLDDITVTFTSTLALWATNAEYSFNAADIHVSNFACRKVDVHSNDLEVSGTVVDIELSECNYEGLNNREIFTIGEVCTKYIYINGRSLYYAYGNENIRLFANLDGKENTLSILIDEEVNDIKEIIVQKGCSVPAVVSSTKSMEIYGNSISYYVLNSHSYSGSGSSFTEDSKIYWTLWFDGGNPKRVLNSSTFDLDTVEKGVSDETKRFVRWVDTTGTEAKGYSRIVSGREYFGEYIYIHLVKVLGLGKTIEFRVDNYTRLTDVQLFKNYVEPTKDGYFFMGYKQEDGSHYNISNRVTRDLTIEATWKKVDSNDNSKLVIMVASISGAVGILSIAAILFSVLKKKKAK